MPSSIRALPVAVALLACALAAPAVAPAATKAPGPKLTVTAAQAKKALTCTKDVAAGKHDPVLMMPAFSTDQESYGWNYLREFPRRGIPVCSYSLPDHGFADLQVAAEYAVLGIRDLARRSGRKVALVSHQHGPLEELWALKFWPDLAGKVSDLVSLATPYHGTQSAAVACKASPTGCSESTWQIAAGSKFTARLLKGGLPKGPAYTSIATAQDTLITPQPAASRLAGASNIVLQDVCPGRSVNHFTILADATASRFVFDALSHKGPAKVSRVKTPCAGTFMPAWDARLMGAASAGFASGSAIYSKKFAAKTEPALRAYAR